MPAKVKIGYVLGAYPKASQKEARMRAVRSRADESIELHFLQADAAMDTKNWTTQDTAMSEGHYVEAFRRAEKEGCDAVVPDGMLDLGVEAGRSVVNIPVVAPFEAAIHLACCVGTRIGVLQYTSEFLPSVWAKVRKYAMGEYIVGVKALDIEMMDLADMMNVVKERTVAASRALIKEQTAEVIVPTGPGLCPVAVDPEWLSREIGAPVVEGMGAPLHVAAAMVRLGLKQSRVRWPYSAR